MISRLLLLCLFAAALRGNVTSVEVVPRDTDPAISSAFNSPHSIYVDREIVASGGSHGAGDRHELLVFLPGTGGTAQGAKAFCELGARLGYHVINLEYPDSIPAAVCAGDADPAAFEQFRNTVIHGGKSPHISVAPADCIENRLTKLVAILAAHRTDENWAQFLTDDHALRWDLIAIAGHSQGGGHAALLGIQHRVARVVCTGAPKDFSKRLGAPAAWYGLKSATPKSCFFSFTHRQDVKGCTPEQQRENVQALNLDGPPVDVTSEAPPYRHSRILLTSFPLVGSAEMRGKGADIAHSSVIATQLEARLKPTWTYLLTEKVP